MFNHTGNERRIIFRPYSPLGQSANVYVCVGCGKHFVEHGDMAELTMRFAEHLCEPVFMEMEVEERLQGAWKH